MNVDAWAALDRIATDDMGILRKLELIASSRKASPMTGIPVTLIFSLLLGSGVPISAHDHPQKETNLNEPVDALLWIHIFLQAAVWGIIFPTGMVLGITRSKWHVPLQVSVIDDV
jgi:hypothetical protein